MSASKRGRAHVEDCLRSVERLLHDGNLELAGLTLDFAHPDLGRMADKGQSDRLRAAQEALGRGEPESGNNCQGHGGFGPH